MHVYLLEWAGYHFSLRSVTPLEVRGEVNWGQLGATIYWGRGEGRSGDNTHLLLYVIMQSHSFMTSTSLRE